MKHALIFTALCVSVTQLNAQQLPDGPGRAELDKLCKQCHELARSVSLRQDRNAWSNTMAKMSAFGMKSTDQEATLVLDYLAQHFPADPVPPVNVNTARAIDLEAGLSLLRSQAKALVEYREKKGPIKSIEELKKLPFLNAAHMEARKHKIEF